MFCTKLSGRNKATKVSKKEIPPVKNKDYEKRSYDNTCATSHCV